MEKTVVTVICISYNQAPYVYKALSSLRDQSYPHLQVIVADDASTDDTVQEIQRFLADHPALSWTTLFHRTNVGNCKTFNEGLAQAEGKYIIDLAADDWLYNSCVAKQVHRLEALSEEYGVVFSNVDLVNVHGELRAKHYPVNRRGESIRFVPAGNVYEEIVKRYFVSPVSMMMKRSVLLQLGGYDESLAYEDFDFWVRSSRLFKYDYIDECLAAKRDTPRSLSTQFRKTGNDRMFESTARICQKIAWLNQTEQENQALLQRINYEMKQALRYKSIQAARIYLQLMQALGVNVFKRMVYKIVIQAIR